MVPRKLFFYWERTKYPYIDYCIKSIKKRCGVEYHLITPNNVEKYLKGCNLASNFKNIRPISQRTDIIRVALLHKYGGSYADADSVMLKDMNSTFDNLKEADKHYYNFRVLLRIYNLYHNQDYILLYN